MRPVAKSGKQKALKDPRNFSVSNYLSTSNIVIPVSYDWTAVRQKEWGTFSNDQLNNCTCAAAGHMIKCWTANASLEFEITEEAIISSYIELSKYDPVTAGKSLLNIGCVHMFKR